MDNQGGWEKVNWAELIGAAMISLGVGIIKLLMFIRNAQGRYHWFDLLLEPSLALFGGFLAWAIAEHMGSPDVLQAAMTSVGAYCGTKTIHWAQKRFLGGSRSSDFAPLDETQEHSEAREKQ